MAASLRTQSGTLCARARNYWLPATPSSAEVIFPKMPGSFCKRRALRPLRTLERGLLNPRRNLRIARQSLAAIRLCRSDFRAQIDILDRIQQLDAFLHGALEGFAPGDKARAAGALVDDRRGHGFFEIVRAGSAAAVDQTRAAHIAVRHLVAAQVNGMIAAQVGVNALVEFAVAGIPHIERLVAAVVLRQFLLDDVGFDGHAKMVGLAGEVC